MPKKKSRQMREYEVCFEYTEYDEVYVMARSEKEAKKKALKERGEFRERDIIGVEPMFDEED